jgi:hypothetical protein
MSSASVAVPALISDLVERGIWPATPDAARALTFDPDVVRSVSADEHALWLSPPPFNVLAADNPDWFDQFRRPDELDYNTALILGDFGPGSDNPIVLDTSSSPQRVVALSFTALPNPAVGAKPRPDGANYRIEGRWVVLAPTLEQFVVDIGLVPSR